MSRRLTVLSCFLFLALCLARPAAASVVNCSDPAYTASCAAIANFSVTGGPNPYVYVQDSYPGSGLTHYLDLSDPTQISYSCPSSACAGVSELASGSLATGILTISGEAVSIYDDADSLGIGANDIFTLTGPAGSVSISATFTVNGTAMLAAVGAGGSILIDGGDASVALCGPGGSFNCGGDTFQATGPAPFLGGTEPINLSVTETWTQPAGVPFNVAYSMNLDAYSGSAIDLTDPGTLTFSLPSGYSLTSQGGYSAVPEPGALPLLAAGFFTLGVYARRRRLR